MPGNDSPRLIKILIRLGRNWANTKNRYERATKRLERAGTHAPDANDGDGYDPIACAGLPLVGKRV